MILTVSKVYSWEEKNYIALNIKCYKNPQINSEYKRLKFIKLFIPNTYYKLQLLKKRFFCKLSRIY